MEIHFARPLSMVALLVSTFAAHAQIHAMANYETKSADSLKALK